MSETLEAQNAGLRARVVALEQEVSDLNKALTAVLVALELRDYNG